ncbi:DUF6152 family protein [Halotalea alkalilenta]|uniref:DUF6152 family protein n=1 Tax=Halotalea alkalilenta TaxID=376489 RepID=UPI00048605D5|nr:DUF6152 family protein [Halotalea alkalilenta]
MRIEKPSAILAGLCVCALLATKAAAHHGWSWAEGELSELTGTIREVSFAPPHPSLEVEIEGEVWQVDLGNPNQTQRSGFAQGSAEVGDEVTILGNRSLDESENLIKAVRITIDGQNYDMYPGRIEG